MSKPIEPIEPLSRKRVEDELNAFIEWPSEDRSSVTTTSCILFADVMQRMAHDLAVEGSEQWRNLAIQFDSHRIQAMALIRAVASGAATADDCAAFAAKPPIPAHEVTANAERYLYLRNTDEWPESVDYAVECGSPSQIDVAVDAAMANRDSTISHTGCHSSNENQDK